MQLFMRICTVIVIIELFATLCTFLLVALSDRLSGGGEQGTRAGNHTLCALTNKPCMYADGDRNACDDCPAAHEYFYKQEAKEKGFEDQFSGIQDEGRAGELP